jgi:hypothetical protein
MQICVRAARAMLREEAERHRRDVSLDIAALHA